MSAETANSGRAAPTGDSRWIEKSRGPRSHSLGIAGREIRGLGAHGGDGGRMGRAGGQPARTLWPWKPERQGNSHGGE